MKCMLYLKLLYQKNKPEFVLLLVLQIVICCVLNFAYAKTESSRYSVNSYNDNMRTFVINSNKSMEIRAIKENLININEPIESAYAVINEENDRTEFCTYLIGEEEAVISSAKNFSLDNSFNYSQWKNQNSVLLAVRNLYSYDKEQKSISVNKKNFGIVGMADSYLEKYSIVPFKAAEVLDSKKIVIGFKHQLNAEDVISIHYELYGLFGSEIDDPIKRDYTFEESLNNSMILLYVMVISVLITEGYLFMYILKKCKREFSIFMILGCTLSRNMINIYLSIIIMICSQILLGDVIYMFILKKPIKATDPLTWVFSDIKCICFSLVIMILTISVLIIPIFMRFQKNKHNTYLEFSKSD